MKPVNFDYVRPDAVDAVIRLIADDSRTVKMMAGSQSLGPMLNLRLVQPDLIVDLTGIEELRRFSDGADEISIGACVTHADIEDLRVTDVTRGALPTDYVNPHILKGTGYATVEEFSGSPAFLPAMRSSLAALRKEYPHVRVVLVNREGAILGKSP